MDDYALFADSKAQLWAWKSAVIEFLADLRLTIHASAAQVQPVTAGIPWLGFVVYPTHRLLKRRNARYGAKKVRLSSMSEKSGRTPSHCPGAASV